MLTKANGQVNGALTIINYADGSDKVNKIAFGDTLTASGDITITNQETEIDVNNNANISGHNVTINAGQEDNWKNVNVNGGSITAHNGANNAALTIKGNTITTKGNLVGDSVALNADEYAIVAGGSITGNNVNIASVRQVWLNGGSITVQNNGTGQLTVNAGSYLDQKGSAIVVDKASFNAKYINLNKGSLVAQEATLAVAENNSSEYSIIENASDFTLDADKLTASAIKGHIKLDSKSNLSPELPREC